MIGKNFFFFLLAIILAVAGGYFFCDTYMAKENMFYCMVGSVAIVLTIFGIYVLYKREKQRGWGGHETELPEGGIAPINPTLDSYHKAIVDALDLAYASSKKSWDAEKALFSQGESKMPAGHLNISNMWGDHAGAHASISSKIAEVKRDLLSHFENVDSKQFHWAK